MTALAKSRGFKTQTLIRKQVTAKAVPGAILKAARALKNYLFPSTNLIKSYVQRITYIARQCPQSHELAHDQLRRKHPLRHGWHSV